MYPLTCSTTSAACVTKAEDPITMGETTNYDLTMYLECCYLTAENSLSLHDGFFIALFSVSLDTSYSSVILIDASV